MNTETLEYKGFRIEVAQDENAENPVDDWDGEPPLMAHGGSRHGRTTSYNGAPEDWRDLVELLPASCFDRIRRVDLVKQIFVTPEKMSLKEFAGIVRDLGGDVRGALVEALNDCFNESPSGWRDAIEWMETAETLLTFAGIPCLQTQSNGHSQGDTALLLVIATPEWLALTGVKPEDAKAQLEGTAELYGAWAWGDVYGVSRITAPVTPEEAEDGTEGREIEDGACWGFYGRDHEKSGLMEHARTSIDWHLEQMEQTALNEPACLI